MTVQLAATACPLDPDIIFTLSAENNKCELRA